jgi:tetratricopeptide (TPR) repeat protein
MQLASALLVAIGAATAAADPQSDGAEARMHSSRGLAHHSLSELTQAIEDFERAYRAVPDPALLYNLAQAHRLANHPERALHFYRAFLHAVPDTENRADAERRIADAGLTRTTHVNSYPGVSF